MKLRSNTDSFEIAKGLLFTHARISANTTKTLESASFLYALIELLNEKGLLSIEELDERKRQVAERLVKKFTQSGMGLMYQDPEYDKYTFEHEAKVDCPSRLHMCKAVCCKFPFALSRQDYGRNFINQELMERIDRDNSKIYSACLSNKSK